MTAAINRTAHYADLIGTIDDARARPETTAVALLVGKLEGLETINARLGYSAGDQAIAAFHGRLLALAREYDHALQLSGSVFAFVVNNPHHQGHIMLAADKIARLAEEWVDINGQRARLSASMGCAAAASARLSSAELLEQAEAALRQCRASDKHAVLYAADGEAAAATATHPLFDARSAIENGEFRVFYQPQFALEGCELVGVEALIRWAGPNGLVAPGSFMNELERSRALLPLLQLVINNASREMARWVRRVPELTVSINSTAADLEDADLAQVMSEVLSMWNLDPRHLTLEITETSLMSNPERGIATLCELRELGMRTSIDDFGTGYSSLAWLKDLPVDEIKIDRSFVTRIVDDARDRQIVESIIDLGHAMNLTVVAEGIESAAMLRVLQGAGCDVGQGYWFAEPLSAREFERGWLAEPAAVSAE
ncbi:MAG: GGDEF domain-containing phosphodiesterase [Gammaproteobacteria bacterium]|jgi:diguanylate cyclase (GGDEF)-like protein|nr:GGDEF domain-containing phosphodiesterase [Gammaproteobacteria bacterium]